MTHACPWIQIYVLISNNLFLECRNDLQEIVHIDYIDGMSTAPYDDPIQNNLKLSGPAYYGKYRSTATAIYYGVRSRMRIPSKMIGIRFELTIQIAVTNITFYVYLLYPLRIECFMVFVHTAAHRWIPNEEGLPSLGPRKRRQRKEIGRICKFIVPIRSSFKYQDVVKFLLRIGFFVDAFSYRYIRELVAATANSDGVQAAARGSRPTFYSKLMPGRYHVIDFAMAHQCR
jgi:hypothetical protein